MNKEEEIYNEIIKRFQDIKSGNEYLLSVYKWDKEKCLASPIYGKEYKLLDYLDWRKNLIHIPLYCEYTWKKISKANIKKRLQEYLITN